MMPGKSDAVNKMWEDLNIYECGLERLKDSHSLYSVTWYSDFLDAPLIIW